MSCLKEISLLVILGCLAVLAETDKSSENTPRAINDEDFKLLINPFSFLQIKTTTEKPSSRPPTIVVKPEYPHYPYYSYYPYYPFYPSYPNDNFHKPSLPQLPHPTHPTHPTEQSTKPTHPTPPPVQPPHFPINPSYPPLYPFYSPTTPQILYGYFPQQQPGQPLYFVVIQPPTGETSSVPAVPEMPDLPNVPILRNVPHLLKVLDVALKDNTNASNLGSENDGDDKSSKYFLRNPISQYVKFAKDLLPAKLATEKEQEQIDNENESLAHNIELNGVSISADSKEDDDTLIVDTKDIKLPFGLHLASHPGSNKKIRNQEALIYLKNFKKGRNLETETDTEKV